MSSLGFSTKGGFISWCLRNTAMLRWGHVFRALRGSSNEQPVPVALGAALSSLTPHKGQGYGTWLPSGQETPSNGFSSKRAGHISQEHGITQGTAHPKCLMQTWKGLRRGPCPVPLISWQQQLYPNNPERVFGPFPIPRMKRFALMGSHCSSFPFLSPWVSSALCLQDVFGSLKPGNLL